MTALVRTEDEVLLADSARDVLADRAPLSRLRALRDAGEVHDAPLWATLVELGWPAIAVPETHDGLGLGLSGLGEVCEVLGRTLALAPLASSAVGATLDPGFGVQTGRVLALAWRERPRGGWSHDIDARVVDGRLTGRKRDVRDASVADAFAVSAWEGDAVRVFRVDAAHASVTRRNRIDWGDRADVAFDGAPATPLGASDDLDRALDVLGAVEAAEALGAATHALDLTLAYSRERVQFGAPIGSFQALQHRLVDAFMGLELARSAVMQALRVPQTRWVALAQAKVSTAFLRAAGEAVQIHGGIGMTDECDVGFLIKRARAYAAEVHGCRARFARRG